MRGLIALCELLSQYKQHSLNGVMLIVMCTIFIYLIEVGDNYIIIDSFKVVERIESFMCRFGNSFCVDTARHNRNRK